MKTQRNVLVKYLARGSFLCVLIFVVLVVLLHVLRPQLNPLSHAISEYAIGPYGFLMTLAFIMRGLGELFLVVGLALGITRSSRSWTGLVLLTLSTLCTFLVAIFPGNPQDMTVLLIHSVSALFGFSSLAIAALVWSLRLRKDTLWYSSTRVSLILALLMLLSLLFFIGVVVGPSSSFQGLAERVLEIFIVLWLCFMAWGLSLLVPARDAALGPTQVGT